jgi:hypothetical protein
LFSCRACRLNIRLQNACRLLSPCFLVGRSLQAAVRLRRRRTAPFALR